MLSYYPIRISFYLSLGTQRLYHAVPLVPQTVPQVIPRCVAAGEAGAMVCTFSDFLLYTITILKFPGSS